MDVTSTKQNDFRNALGSGYKGVFRYFFVKLWEMIKKVSFHFF